MIIHYKHLKQTSKAMIIHYKRLKQTSKAVIYRSGFKLLF